MFEEGFVLWFWFGLFMFGIGSLLWFYFCYWRGVCYHCAQATVVIVLVAIHFAHFCATVLERYDYKQEIIFITDFMKLIHHDYEHLEYLLLQMAKDFVEIVALGTSIISYYMATKKDIKKGPNVEEQLLVIENGDSISDDSVEEEDVEAGQGFAGAHQGGGHGSTSQML